MRRNLISVLGGTGLQGGGVVDALLAQGTFKVRVASRNPTSDRARALSARGVGLKPQPLPDGGRGWAVPMDPALRVIHAGDVTEVGRTVAAAFGARDELPNGSVLAVCGGRYSWNDFANTLNALGHAPVATIRGRVTSQAEVRTKRKNWRRTIASPA